MIGQSTAKQWNNLSMTGGHLAAISAVKGKSMTQNDAYREFKEQAYAKMSADAPAYFPEFAFKRSPKGWESTNSLKVDGGQGEAIGKVWIFDNRPGQFFDYRTNEYTTFWNYFVNVKRIDKPLVEFSKLTGIALPAREKSEGPVQLVAGVHPDILNRCLKLFAGHLTKPGRGQQVVAYLKEQRGYSDELIQKMGVGVLPELPVLQKELYTLKIERRYVDYFIKLLEKKDKFHHLALPCFGKHGALEGFIFRAIAPIPTKEGKYSNLSHLNVDAGILNLPRNCEEAIIVEGILDSLVLKALGRANVVPLNGSSLSEEQLAALTEQGIKRIIFCLDNDDQGEKALSRIVERSLKAGYPLEVYIARLPDGIKDADELVKQSGLDAFDGVISRAIGIGQYLGEQLVKAFPSPEAGQPLPSLLRSRVVKAAADYCTSLPGQPLEQHDLLRVVYGHLADSLLSFAELKGVADAIYAQSDPE